MYKKINYLLFIIIIINKMKSYSVVLIILFVFLFILLLMPNTCNSLTSFLPNNSSSKLSPSKLSSIEPPMNLINQSNGELVIPSSTGTLIQTDTSGQGIRVCGSATTAPGVNSSNIALGTSAKQIQFYNNGNLTAVMDVSGCYVNGVMSVGTGINVGSQYALTLAGKEFYPTGPQNNYTGINGTGVSLVPFINRPNGGKALGIIDPDTVINNTNKAIRIWPNDGYIDCVAKDGVTPHILNLQGVKIDTSGLGNLTANQITSSFPVYAYYWGGPVLKNGNNVQSTSEKTLNYYYISFNVNNCVRENWATNGDSASLSNIKHFIPYTGLYNFSMTYHVENAQTAGVGNRSMDFFIARNAIIAEVAGGDLNSFVNLIASSSVTSNTPGFCTNLSGNMHCTAGQYVAFGFYNNISDSQIAPGARSNIKMTLIQRTP